MSSKDYRSQDDSRTIRRTVVERGFRPVDGDRISTATAITTIARKHEDEQRELQELNVKFAAYLDRVYYLEDHNKRLSNDLENLRRSWGGDIDHLHSVYDPQLRSLREAIDRAIRDQALQDLQLKRHEYDSWQIQQQIATLNPDFDLDRLNFVKQQLDQSIVELEQTRAQFEQRLDELARHRQLMESLLNELHGLKNELDNQQLERILLENEIQTLREHTAFQGALHQVQRAELMALGTPSIDVSSFYRAELARAISDIRQDFEVLSHSRANELEEYYRVKTEQVRQEIAAEDERKRLLASEGVLESMDTSALSSSLRDTSDDLKTLKNQNRQLQLDLDALVNDLEMIQNDQGQQNQSIENEFNQLRQEIDVKRSLIDNLLEGNVSLRFEISTYRRLLEVEEKHLDRVGNENERGKKSISALVSSSISSDRTTNEIGTKKMTVQKTARGPISIESVDLETDSVVLVNEKYSGSNQSFENWTLRRQIDQQPELVYSFPSTFSLRPRQTIRLLSKKSPNGLRSSSDVLLADRIESWGQGHRMVTRLIDNNNDEKAIITQTFQ